jgi:hypothetical protein
VWGTFADAAVVDVVMDGIRDQVFGQIVESADSQSCSFAFDHVALDLVVAASYP